MKRTITVIGTGGYWRNKSFYLPDRARAILGDARKIRLEWNSSRPQDGHRWKIIVIDYDKLLLLRGWESVVVCREGWHTDLGLPEHGYVSVTKLAY